MSRGVVLRRLGHMRRVRWFGRRAGVTPLVAGHGEPSLYILLLFVFIKGSGIIEFTHYLMLFMLVL